MDSDAEDLLSYASRGDEIAFRRIVTRHAAMVHGVAVRITGDKTLAEDVTQAVFVILATRAKSLQVGNLAGWLHSTSALASRNALRKEHRRLRHTRSFHQDMTVTDPQPATPRWQEVAPHLDAAIDSLSRRDRDVVVSHFIQGQTFRHIAGFTGSTEEACRKRSQRALQRITAFLRRRGVTATSVTALAGVIATGALTAPRASAATLSSSALNAAKLAPALSITATLLHLMKTQQIASITIASLLLVGVPATILARRSPEKLGWLTSDSGSKSSLRQRERDPNDALDPRLNVRRQGNEPKATALPVSALEPMLQHFSRSPESLALAYLITHDPKLFLELKDHDRNPTAVTLLAVNSGSTDKLFWSRRLTEIDPANGLGKLMETATLLESGRPEEAIAAGHELASAQGIHGGMDGINRILPEAAGLLPQSYRVDLVFDDLVSARVSSIYALVPWGLRDGLSKLPKEDVLPFAAAYLKALDLAATGDGFSAPNPGKFQTSAYVIGVEREVVLGSVGRLIGDDEVLKIDPEPMAVKSNRTMAELHESVARYRALTPQQVDALADETLGIPAR